MANLLKLVIPLLNSYKIKDNWQTAKYVHKKKKKKKKFTVCTESKAGSISLQ